MEKKMTTMRDALGNEIPVKYVAAYDKARDRAARKILARFLKARAALEQVVRETVADLDDLKGGKDKLGEKGNFQASSFDGLIKVAIKQQYNIRLDERVIRARELMLEYVNGVLDRVSGVDVSALRLLVQQAFRANNQGYLSTGKVLALMRMEVDSAKWREAKSILQAALQPQRGKKYIVVETRPNNQADFKSIRLDIADCWPGEEA